MINSENYLSVCPVCECHSGTYSVHVGNYQIIKCPNCGLEYTIPNPDDKKLEQFYGSYHDIRANPEIVTLNARRNIKSLKEYGLNNESSLLDFGCGNGEFVELAGDRCFGVELSTRGQCVRIVNNIDALPAKRYDFITLWGVLEHLNDPVETIRELTKRLASCGKLVITTVNAEGVIPYYFKPPEHLTYWTEKSIRYLLEMNGLAIRSIQPYEMFQFNEIYLDRLLSRTPEHYRKILAHDVRKLPRIMTVPTNEFLVVAEHPKQ